MDVNSQEKVYAIPIDAIDDFPDHPFQVRDDEEMAQLVRSIDNNGVLNPIIVRQNGERYELIAGHRRRHACDTSLSQDTAADTLAEPSALKPFPPLCVNSAVKKPSLKWWTLTFNESISFQAKKPSHTR